MGEEKMKMGSVLNEKLKSLCCRNGWSFGVFWRFDLRNSMLLTVKDAYFEEQMAPVVNNLLPKVHMLGEGIVGQAAFTGNHRWIFSDSNNGEWSLEDYEIGCLFSMGIKTIAVISVESQGVIQFGSTQKILERSEFLDQTKRLLGNMEHTNGPSSPARTLSSLNSEGYDLHDWFASFCTENITPLNSGSSDELMEIAYGSMDVAQPMECMPFAQQETMSPFLDPLLHLNQLQTAGSEAQVMLCSNPSSCNKLATKSPCISEQSYGGSVLTSVEPLLPSEMRTYDSPIVNSTNEKMPPGCWITENFPQESTSSAFYSHGKMTDSEKTSREISGRSMINNNSAPFNDKTAGQLPERETNLPRITEEFKLGDFTTYLCGATQVDDIIKLFAPLPEQSISGMTTVMNETLPQSVGDNSALSGLHPDVLLDTSLKKAANLVESSIDDRYVCGGQKKSAINHCAQRDIFEGSGLEFESSNTGDCWENLMAPVASFHHLGKSTGVSECISKLGVEPMVVPRKGLFSELGLEKLLNGSSSASCFTKSSDNGQLSGLKRRMESSSSNDNEVQKADVFSSVGMGMQSAYSLDKISNLPPKKEVCLKSQVGLWIDDSYSINTGSPALANTKKPDEPTKAIRKRARPGESTRPRPKDRQQIQDRIKELRGIIPDSTKADSVSSSVNRLSTMGIGSHMSVVRSKTDKRLVKFLYPAFPFPGSADLGVLCSIDSLLDRTIKHMLFLQNVTKYADKLKQIGEPKAKLIGQDNKMALKDSSKRGGGATWAVEYGAQTMACPIIVEDLSPPGLMLIEMLCEDHGFFLEIVDVIKGVGLNILKGAMEIREDKIWACFIAEAMAPITRVEIFLSLLELLHPTGTSGRDSRNQPNCVMNGKIPLLNNYQYTALSCPLGLAET